MAGIAFTVPGKIVGKGRGRVGKLANGRPVVFTPQRTVNCEAVIRSLAFDAMRGHPPMAGALRIDVRIFVAYPMSWTKTKRLARGAFVTGKPDVDNLLKTCTDAMNGIAYNDDSQIASAVIERYYTDGQTRAEISVTNINEQPQAGKFAQARPSSQQVFDV